MTALGEAGGGGVARMRGAEADGGLAAQPGGLVVGRIVETLADVEEGAAWLVAREPRFARALELAGPLPLRRQESGFGTLLFTIISQQVSVASAAAVWKRLEAAGGVAPEGFAGLPDETLRACGLSRQKIAYGRGLAESGLDWEGLRALPDAAVVAELVRVKGVGVWTAEIYAMFCLGRADVFAPGDLALQEAAREIFGLAERPGEKKLRAMAEDWSPWRAVAARLLWAYYQRANKGEGMG
jgi:DNA-3-methyladenine glycosylase II